MRESGDLVLAGYGHLATAFGLGAVLSLRLRGQTEPVGEEIEGPVPLDAGTWNAGHFLDGGELKWKAPFGIADLAVLVDGKDMWGWNSGTQILGLTLDQLDNAIDTFLASLKSPTRDDWLERSVPIAMIAYRMSEAISNDREIRRLDPLAPCHRQFNAGRFNPVTSTTEPTRSVSQAIQCRQQPSDVKELSVSQAIQYWEFGPDGFQTEDLKALCDEATGILQGGPTLRQARALAYRMYCRSACQETTDSELERARQVAGEVIRAAQNDPVTRWLVCDAFTDWGWRGRVAKQKENLGLAFVSVPEPEPEFLEWLRERPDRFRESLSFYANLRGVDNPYTEFDIHAFFRFKEGASPIMLDFLRDLETGIMMASPFMVTNVDSDNICSEQDVREIIAGQTSQPKNCTANTKRFQQSFSPGATLAMWMSVRRFRQEDYAVVEKVLKCALIFTLRANLLDHAFIGELEARMNDAADGREGCMKPIIGAFCQHLRTLMGGQRPHSRWGAQTLHTGIVGPNGAFTTANSFPLTIRPSSLVATTQQPIFGPFYQHLRTLMAQTLHTGTVRPNGAFTTANSFPLTIRPSSLVATTHRPILSTPGDAYGPNTTHGNRPTERRLHPPPPTASH